MARTRYRWCAAAAAAVGIGVIAVGARFWYQAAASMPARGSHPVALAPRIKGPPRWKYGQNIGRVEGFDRGCGEVRIDFGCVRARRSGLLAAGAGALIGHRFGAQAAS